MPDAAGDRAAPDSRCVIASVNASHDDDPAQIGSRRPMAEQPDLLAHQQRIDREECDLPGLAPTDGRAARDELITVPGNLVIPPGIVRDECVPERAARREHRLGPIGPIRRQADVGEEGHDRRERTKDERLCGDAPCHAARCASAYLSWLFSPLKRKRCKVPARRPDRRRRPSIWAGGGATQQQGCPGWEFCNELRF